MESSSVSSTSTAVPGSEAVHPPTPVPLPSLQPQVPPVSQPPTRIPAEPDAKEIVRALRQDVRWEAAMPEPTFAGFRAWAKEFAKAKTPDEKTALMAQGLELARQR